MKGPSLKEKAGSQSSV